ncbi:LOW QUALITY PROTEIN: hypothetical protein QTO34_017049 [Cnephaeus nilssonii]|uniref:Uncharacterized protein n=1 Tax=Cnephaeus nilssonii TaxID=3371016 RepID=A0AA40I093_CNENI|nr:LOW QUALITY PROTEIN: hypothetical protein QTO34_017049 [Eptesicus nilssonii]
MLEKGAPQAYLEGTLSGHINHLHSSQGLNTWIHHSWVKAAHQLSDIQSEWKVTSDQKHPLWITLKMTADLAEQPAPRNSDNTLLNSP